MSRFKITKPNKELIKRASREWIETYFDSVPASRKSKRWIRVSNCYRIKAAQNYERDAKASPSRIKAAHISEYIGASAPTHVIDGWSFLGRAIEAALRGDTYSAIHFGYYSELRAAMALLAAEGIGIFSRRHAVLNSPSTCEPLPKKVSINKTPEVGTHRIVWPLLDYWASLKRSSDLLDDIVSPKSLRMSQWLLGTGAIVPVRAIAQYWLRTWGIDLAAVDDDHDARNLASYRPSEFRKPPRLDKLEVVSFVEDLWTLFEPEPIRRFPVIERVLLKAARQRATSRAVAIPQLEGIGLSSAEAAEWSTFFGQPEPRPLIAATKQSAVDDAYCHLQVIARATLLLFVATSAARRLLTKAAYSTKALSFWWQVHGEDRCLWPIGESPEDPLDVWADILGSISDSANWRTANAATTSSLREWRQANPSVVDLFGGLELIGIWGLMP